MGFFEEWLVFELLDIGNCHHFWFLVSWQINELLNCFNDSLRSLRGFCFFVFGFAFDHHTWLKGFLKRGVGELVEGKEDESEKKKRGVGLKPKGCQYLFDARIHSSVVVSQRCRFVNPSPESEVLRLVRQLADSLRMKVGKAHLHFWGISWRVYPAIISFTISVTCFGSNSLFTMYLTAPLVSASSASC